MVALASVDRDSTSSKTANSGAPSTTLTNGLIKTDVFLPDPEIGFYRGTRFEWAGVISNFTYAGHTFYNNWFTSTEPGIRDFIYRGNEIVTGEASGITGPAEEFVQDDAAMRYSVAPAGGTFLKIGVGMLRKPDMAKYDEYRLYQIVNGGKWTAITAPDWVSITQVLLDEESGFGYEYQKTICLIAGQPRMRIEHSLKNIGERKLDTQHYNHNFLALDGETTGPAYRVTVPYEIELHSPINEKVGAVVVDSVIFKKNLEGEESFSLAIGGFSQTQDDYCIHIQNSRLNVGVTVVGDRPLQRVNLWTIRTVLSVEPYVVLSIPKGGRQTWAYEYTYSA